MSDADRIRATFQDLTDDQAVNLVYTPHATSGGTLSAYWPLVVAVTVTNLVMVRQDISIVGPGPGPGSGGDYPLASDMCTLEFTCADGSKQPYSWSGPIAAAFTADHVTVDASQVDIADLITWLLAHATNAAGSPFVEYSRGWRWSLTP